MDQLLQITNIPIAFEMKINNARLEYRSENTQMEITRGEGGLKIKSQPIKLDIDQFECFNSVNPSVRTSIRNAAQKGKLAAYEATAAYAKEGKLFLNAKIGEDVIGEISASKTDGVNTNVGIKFTPTAQPEFNWSPPELSIKYELEKLNFDWKIQNGDFEFIPGDIEISITQQPDVVIEYIGRPLYIPPSADPTYEEPTTDITV